MTRQELIAWCLEYPDAYEDYPFGSDAAGGAVWTAMRHVSNKKTFAFLFERGGLCVNLKCEPARADLQRQLFDGVTAAYHMNKTHWNTVRVDSDVPEDILLQLIDDSYAITAPKIRRRPEKQEKAGVTNSDERAVRMWMDALQGSNIRTKKMFGCYCVYCDDQAVGWLSGDVFSLREVGLPYLPAELKRPAPDASCHEIVIPLKYCSAEWLPRAVQQTADICKAKKK